MTVRKELRETARSGSLGFIGALLSAGGAFLLVVIVSRGLGPTGAGVFAMLVSVWMTLSVSGRLGVDSALVRLLPRLALTGQAGAMREAIRASLLPTCVVMTCVAAAVWWLAPDVCQWLTGSNEHVQLLRLVAILLPLSTGSYIALAATRGLGSIKPLVVVENIVKPALRCVLVSLVLLVGAGIYGVTIAWALATVLGVGVSIWALLRVLRRFPVTDQTDKADTSTWNEIWGFALPRAGAQTCEILAMHAGVVLTGLLGSASEAGIYNAVMRLVMAGTLAVHALNLALAPQISRLLALRDHSQAEDIHHATSTWIVLITWPLYVLVALWPHHSLALFGHEFVAGSGTLTILCVATLLSLSAGNVGTILLMSGRSGANIGVAVVSLTFQIGGALLLAPWIGAAAVIATKAVAIVGESAAMVWIVKRGEGISTFNRATAIAMGLAATCFGIPALACYVTDHTGLEAAIVAALVGLVCYLAVVVRLRSVLHCDVFVGLLQRKTQSSPTAKQPTRV